MRLRGRLLTSFAYLLVLAVVALAVPLAINVQRRARADLDARVEGQALVIASSIDAAILGPRPHRDLIPVVGQYAGDVGARVVVTDARGLLLADSDRPSVAGEDWSTGQRPEIAAALRGERDTRQRTSDTLGTDLLVSAVPVIRGQDVIGAVRISAEIAGVERRIRLSWIAIAVAGGFVILAGLAIAWALASSLARPLRGLEQTAMRLGAGDLGARANGGGPRDVAEVATALNHMAADLERTLVAQRDFVANASHQLRTPLTGMRLRLEAIERAGGPKATDASAALAEVDRLNALVDDLLELARVGSPPEEGTTVDLDGVVAAAGERWSERVAARGQTLELHPAPAAVRADGNDLAMALDNLIENAVVYAGEGARITIACGADGTDAFLRVSDSGPGIAAEDLPHVLERFYRGSAGRHGLPGTGLGLAIVDEAAGRWGGRAEVTSRDGATITVHLPRAFTTP